MSAIWNGIMDTEATSIVRVCLRHLCFFPFCRSKLHRFLSKALFRRLASLLFQGTLSILVLARTYTFRRDME